ncbi:MAG: PKD domain-containing protein, partial [bacterium]|nr:PKD domain-containing protein [bacterium]
DGSTVVAGASADDLSSPEDDRGSACVFTKNGAGWDQVKLTGSSGGNKDRFGSAVAVSTDSSTVMVGAYHSDNDSNNDQGAAYRFEYNGSNYVETDKIIVPDGSSFDRLGMSVALSADGSCAVAGAYLANGSEKDIGAAYIFRR